MAYIVDIDVNGYWYFSMGIGIVACIGKHVQYPGNDIYIKDTLTFSFCWCSNYYINVDTSNNNRYNKNR